MVLMLLCTFVLVKKVGLGESDASTRANRL